LAKKVTILNQRGPRPKKATEGPGWLRYATAVGFCSLLLRGSAVGDLVTAWLLVSSAVM